MKLDLNAAWDQAVRLISMNREVMIVLGGVFFFLPYVLFALGVPMPDFQAAAGPAGEDSRALMAVMNGFIAQYWWALLLLSLIQTIGAVAVMAVLGDPARPTVGAAMSRGFRFLLPSVGVQILTSLAVFMALVLAILIGALTGSQAIAATMAAFSIPVIVWLMTRLSLASPSVAIERIANPVAALRRSWRLTSDTGLRLLAFFVLLFIAFVVISQVIGLVIRLLTALPTAEIGTIVGGLLEGLVYAALTMIYYGILASVHRQLARAERTSSPEIE